MADHEEIEELEAKLLRVGEARVTGEIEADRYQCLKVKGREEPARSEVKKRSGSTN